MRFIEEGIVLSRLKKEEDIIVEILTKKGKIIGIAKFGRKSKKRFINTFEPPSIILAEIYKTRFSGKYIIEKATVIDYFEEIKNDIKKTILAWMVTEIGRISITGEHYEKILNSINEIKKYPSIQIPLKLSIEILSSEGILTKEWILNTDISEGAKKTIISIINREKNIYFSKSVAEEVLDFISKFIDKNIFKVYKFIWK